MCTSAVWEVSLTECTAAAVLFAVFCVLSRLLLPITFVLKLVQLAELDFGRLHRFTMLLRAWLRVRGFPKPLNLSNPKAEALNPNMPKP